MRLSDELAATMDALADERGLTPSQLVRDLLVEAAAERIERAALDPHELVARLDADVAEVRRRLVG